MNQPSSRPYAVATDVTGEAVSLTPPSVTRIASEPPLCDAKKQKSFPAWGRGQELAQGHAHGSFVPAGAAAVEQDLGLWLLGAGLRPKVWYRLAAEEQEHSRTRTGSSAAYELAKRVIDVAMASLLLVLNAPLILLALLLVRLDSPGPALFRQKRIGRNGEPFMFWKIRSMYADAPMYEPSPRSDFDPRVTRVGRLLRRASIDELPQLLNVLKGEMSLVGPRPEMPFIVEGYSPRERRRLAVKPGITGLWQISPARGRPIHENVDIDLHYIRHRNLVLDGAILLRTIAAVIRGVGAV